MAGSTSTIVAELSDALRDSYRGVPDVEEFLRTKLDRRFDDLTSRYIPLKDAIFQIVLKAEAEGWLADLIREAAAHRPRQATLRRLKDVVADLDPARMRAPQRSQIDRPSLLCGRALQWNEVCQVAPARVHHAILVPGGRGQEPMHFRDRIQVYLTPDPSREMLTVDWRTTPQSLDEMREALAGALRTGAANIPDALNERLAYRNLVILHPCLTDGFEQAHVIEYYTTWLPSMLPARGSGSLKCVQPLEWPTREPASGLLGRVLSFGRGGSNARDSVLGLMQALRSRQSAALRVIDVDELVNLERREIENFLEGSEFTPEHQKILLDRLLGGPQVPGFMFTTIDDYWKRTRMHA